MSTRRRAREVVVQLLFQRDLNPDADAEVEHVFLRSRLKHNPAVVGFAESLVAGIQKHRESIDQALGDTVDNWRLERMAATDRSILRLATYEMLFTDTPPRVAVNEAIELAKRFGTGNSAQFVNGVLDRLMKSRLPVSEASPAPPSSHADQPSRSDHSPDCD